MPLAFFDVVSTTSCNYAWLVILLRPCFVPLMKNYCYFVQKSVSFFNFITLSKSFFVTIILLALSAISFSSILQQKRIIEKCNLTPEFLVVSAFALFHFEAMYIFRRVVISFDAINDNSVHSFPYLLFILGGLGDSSPTRTRNTQRPAEMSGFSAGSTSGRDQAKPERWCQIFFTTLLRRNT